MKQGTFYFSHDYNCRSDEKIQKLLAEHGYEGYGLFWALIENLYNNANALQKHYKSIAFNLHTTEEKIKSIINDFDLFAVSDDIISSNSIKRRIQELDEKSDKARKSALYRWEKQKRNANALQTKNECNAINEMKLNEKKGNKIKERKGKKEGDAANAPHSLLPTPDYSIEQKESFTKFQNWINDNAPRVAKMKEPFTISQYLSLVKKGFTPERIRTTLADMHNWTPLLTKNQSAYLTLTKWTKKDEIRP